MFATLCAAILSFQAAQHRRHECECGVVVTSYTATVVGAGSGNLPDVKFTPNHIEYRHCPYAKRMRGER